MDRNNIKTIIQTQEPTKAQVFPKEIAMSFVDKFEEVKGRYQDPVSELEKGNILVGETRIIKDYNDTVRKGVPGQIVEIHGNSNTNTVMAKFVEKDGTVVYEIISPPTPPSVTDREDYYDDYHHIVGTEEGENGELPVSRPRNTELGNDTDVSNSGTSQSISAANVNTNDNAESTNPTAVSNTNTNTVGNTNNSAIPTISNNPISDINEANDASNDNTELGKRKRDSDDENNESKRKKDDDSSDKGGGNSGLGGLGDNAGSSGNFDSSGSGAAGPSNFRSFSDWLVITISYIFSIICELLDFFTFM